MRGSPALEDLKLWHLGLALYFVGSLNGEAINNFPISLWPDGLIAGDCCMLKER